MKLEKLVIDMLLFVCYLAEKSRCKQMKYFPLILVYFCLDLLPSNIIEYRIKACQNKCCKHFEIINLISFCRSSQPWPCPLGLSPSALAKATLHQLWLHSFPTKMLIKFLHFLPPYPTSKSHSSKDHG